MLTAVSGIDVSEGQDITIGRLGRIKGGDYTNTLDEAVGVRIENVGIKDNSITTFDSNADLELNTVGTGSITLNNAINIDDNKIVATRTNDDLVLDAAGTGKVSIAGIKYPTSDGTTGQALVTDGSGNLSFGDVSGGTVQGHQVTLGDFSDSSTQDGALLTDITGASTVTDAVDALNEALLNVSNNTFVRSVDFSSDVTAGGLNLSVTLTITAEGNANRFTIAWGDGSSDVASSDSTPSHTYTDDTNSPYDVTVTAFNSARVEEASAGSEASLTKSNFITAFTADPVAQLSLIHI